MNLTRLSGVDRSSISLAETGQIHLTDEKETEMRTVLLRAIRSQKKDVEKILANVCGQAQSHSD